MQGQQALVVDIVNRINTSGNARQKIQHLEQLEELLLRSQPALLDAFLAELVPLQMDKAVTVRRKLLEFVAAAVRTRPSPAVLSTAAPCIAGLLSDEQAQLAKEAAQAAHTLLLQGLVMLANTPQGDPAAAAGWASVLALQQNLTNKAVALAGSHGGSSSRQLAMCLAGIKMTEQALLQYTADFATRLPIAQALAVEAQKLAETLLQLVALPAVRERAGPVVICTIKALGAACLQRPQMLPLLLPPLLALAQQGAFKAPEPGDNQSGVQASCGAALKDILVRVYRGNSEASKPYHKEIHRALGLMGAQAAADSVNKHLNRQALRREGNKRKAADQSGRDPKAPRGSTPAGPESSYGNTPTRTPTPGPTPNAPSGGGVDFPSDLIMLFRPGPGANLPEVFNNAQQVVEVLVKAQQMEAVEAILRNVAPQVLAELVVRWMDNLPTERPEAPAAAAAAAAAAAQAAPQAAAPAQQPAPPQQQQQAGTGSPLPFNPAGLAAFLQQQQQPQQQQQQPQQQQQQQQQRQLDPRHKAGTPGPPAGPALPSPLPCVLNPAQVTALRTAAVKRILQATGNKPIRNFRELLLSRLASRAAGDEGLTGLMLQHVLSDYHSNRGHLLLVRWLYALAAAVATTAEGQQQQQAGGAEQQAAGEQAAAEPGAAEAEAGKDAAAKVGEAAAAAEAGTAAAAGGATDAAHDAVDAAAAAAIGDADMAEANAEPAADSQAAAGAAAADIPPLEAAAAAAADHTVDTPSGAAALAAATAAAAAAVAAAEEAEALARAAAKAKRRGRKRGRAAEAEAAGVAEAAAAGGAEAAAAGGAEAAAGVGQQEAAGVAEDRQQEAAQPMDTDLVEPGQQEQQQQETGVDREGGSSKDGSNAQEQLQQAEQLVQDHNQQQQQQGGGQQGSHSSGALLDTKGSSSNGQLPADLSGTPYEAVLMASLQGLRQSLPSSDPAIPRLLQEAPVLPLAAVTAFLQGLLTEGADWAGLGLTTAYGLFEARPAARQRLLQLQLEACVSAHSAARDKAVGIVVAKLMGWQQHAGTVLDFATQHLLLLLEPPAAAEANGQEEQQQEQQAAAPNGAEASAAAVAAEGSAEGAAPAGTAADQQQQQQQQGMEAGQQQQQQQPPEPEQPQQQQQQHLDVEAAAQHSMLYMSLCTQRPELLQLLLETYGKAGPDPRTALSRYAPSLALALGPSQPQLLQLILSPPEGSEEMLLAMVTALADHQAPPEPLVAACKGHFEATGSVQLLAPVVAALPKGEVEQLLPKLLLQLPEQRLRLLYRQLAQPIHGKEPLFVPAKLLVMLHTVTSEPSMPKQVFNQHKHQIMAAVDRAVRTPEVFPMAVVTQAINSMQSMNPPPQLFMRSVNLVVQNSLPVLAKNHNLNKFFISLLEQLISKHVWLNNTQWAGFVLCCDKLQDLGSIAVLLQLAPEWLDKALQKLPRSLWQKVYNVATSDTPPVPIFAGTKQVLEKFNERRVRAEVKERLAEVEALQTQRTAAAAAAPAAAAAAGRGSAGTEDKTAGAMSKQKPTSANAAAAAAPAAAAAGAPVGAPVVDSSSRQPPEQQQQQPAAAAAGEPQQQQHPPGDTAPAAAARAGEDEEDEEFVLDFDDDD